MEHKDPSETADLSGLSRKSTGGLPKTSPIRGRYSPISLIELYLFFFVAALVFISGFVVPQRVLDVHEIGIMLALVPFLFWSIRIYLLA